MVGSAEAPAVVQVQRVRLVAEGLEYPVGLEIWLKIRLWIRIRARNHNIYSARAQDSQKGNREKLSNGQACCLAQLCLAVA